MFKRVRIIQTIFILFAFLLCVRLGFIAIDEGKTLAKEAVDQRTRSVPLTTARGVIYDRNMLAMTEGQSRTSVMIIPEKCDSLAEVQQTLGKRVNSEGIQIFAVESIEDMEKLLTFNGITLVNMSERYSQKGILSHVIGYAPVGSAGFGIEKSLDDILKQTPQSRVMSYTDAKRDDITGLGSHIKRQPTMQGVQLTIDYHIQEICEQALKDCDVNGAAIVVEISSGDILAMASAPSFSQDTLAEYLDKNNAELTNRATQSYDMGSVFKTVMAAAAIENAAATSESTYFCSGAISLDGTEYVCNNSLGHGQVTLSSGFAYSCNIPFYVLGQKLGQNKISDMAQKMGIGSPVLDGILEESDGTLPNYDYPTTGDICNISIGQGALSATPLQVASIVTTVANGGIKKPLNLLKGYVAEDGMTITPAEHVPSTRAISKYTADTICDMMRDGVTFGTGQMASIDGWGAGGKTGSAETGWIQSGEKMTHGWFVGFFPADSPQYACVVLAENGKRGGTSAAPVFKMVGEGIKALNSR